MAFFIKRRGTSTGTIKVDDVKVSTTIITSSYNDCSGAGPRCMKWYFLVREKSRKYYEIFANKLIEKNQIRIMMMVL